MSLSNGRRRLGLALLGAATVPSLVYARKAAPAPRHGLATVPGRVGLQALRGARAWLALGLGVDEAASRASLARAISDFERAFGDFRAVAGQFQQGEAALTVPQYWRALKISLSSAPQPAGARSVLGLSESLFGLMGKAGAAFAQGIGTDKARQVAEAQGVAQRVERSLRLALARCWQVAAADAPSTINEDRREIAKWCKEASGLAGDDAVLAGAIQLAQQQWTFLDDALGANVAPNPTAAQGAKLVTVGERMGDALASVVSKLAS